MSTANPRTIVTFGDSITDGTASTLNANKRWPDVLAERLNAAGTPRGISNQAIAGNRVLSYGMQIFGESALYMTATWMSVPNEADRRARINDIGMGANTAHRRHDDQRLQADHRPRPRQRHQGLWRHMQARATSTRTAPGGQHLDPHQRHI